MVRAAAEALLERDVLGLKAASPASIAVAATQGPVNWGASASGMSTARVRQFQAWFDDLLLRVVVEGDGQWTRPYLTEAYRVGSSRAERLTGGDRSLSPIEGDRVDLLHRLSVMELQGICEAVSQRAVRAASEGLLRKMTPREVLREVAAAAAKVGAVRLRAMSDALVVRAHAEATLDVFERRGVRRVGVLAELVPRPRPTADGGAVVRLRDAKKSSKRAVSRAPERFVRVLTAGDNDVCEVCEDLEMQGAIEIEEARGLIPAHPHCRCAFVPVDDERFAEPEDLEDGLRDAEPLEINFDADWNEADHPRDPDGKFASGGGLGGGAGKKAAWNKGKPKATRNWVAESFDHRDVADKTLRAPLTDEETAAIRAYTGSGYTFINGWLRRGSPDESTAELTRRQVAAMDSAFDKASTPRSMTLYRGVSNEVARQIRGNVGGSFRDSGYVSTSTNKKLAKDWGAFGEMFAVVVRAGSRAMPIGHLSNHKNESEVLVDRGTEFRVKTTKNGRVYLEVNSRSQKRR